MGSKCEEDTWKYLVLNLSMNDKLDISCVAYYLKFYYSNLTVHFAIYKKAT